MAASAPQATARGYTLVTPAATEPPASRTALSIDPGENISRQTLPLSITSAFDSCPRAWLGPTLKGGDRVRMRSGEPDFHQLEPDGEPIMRVRLPPVRCGDVRCAKTHSATTPWRRGQHDDESNWCRANRAEYCFRVCWWRQLDAAFSKRPEPIRHDRFFQTDGGR